ncbi:MAG: hypothetical protein QOK04_1130, partial [Solirubrobacteraceae bacterium]|nr:hypothetical protein [Solirubrobacteraceae bacterium]
MRWKSGGTTAVGVALAQRCAAAGDA